MVTYHGVVKGNVVVLLEDIQLEEGTKVEIRPLLEVEVAADETPREAFIRKLREDGLVLNFRDPSQAPPREEFEPIEVECEPLSQMIIRERR